MNYLQLFLRNFRKNKLFTLLNLFGLTIGISAFIYMNEYIHFERSFENFNEGASQVFRITSQKTQNGKMQERKSCAPVVLKSHLINLHPEIEYATRVHIVDPKRLIVTIKSDDGIENTFVEERGYHAEKDFFKIFGTPLLKGNQETALEKPNSIVLTESLAKKYFGDQDPIGQTITLTDYFRMDYQITGVIQDVANSHFQYDFLISFETFLKQRPNWRWQSWDWDYFHTYIKIKEGTDESTLEEAVNRSVALAGKEIFSGSGYSIDFQLQKIGDIHLFSSLGRELDVNGNGELLSYLEIVAYVILLMAWINFINLSTAISNLRAKEVGVRKVIGASKSGLTFQFLMEAFFYNLLAALSSYALIYFANPYLETIADFNFSTDLLFSLRLWIIVSAVVFIGTFGSGLYPAMVLTNVKAISVLKGKNGSSSHGLTLRKLLIVFQFSIAMFLISMTLGIYKQVSFLQKRELGLNIERVLVTSMPNIRDDTFWSNYDNLKNTLQNRSEILMVTTSNEVPGSYINHIELFKLRSQQREEAQIVKFMWIDYDFFELYDIGIKAGRGFLHENQSEVREGVILNEAAAKMLGFEEIDAAIDEPVDWIHSWGEIENYKVIGVIANYEQEANSSTEPMVYIMNRPQIRWYETNYISIKITGDEHINETVQFISDIHNTVYSQDAFDFFFLDDNYNKLYQSDLRFGKIFNFFSLLTLSIMALGLFGLTAFFVINRRKEVSIRRVLGARFNNLLAIFSKTYLMQIGISIIVAMPLSYLMLNAWMNKFINKMPLSAEIFLLPVLIILIITGLTIFFHLSRTIRQNPAQVIREE